MVVENRLLHIGEVLEITGLSKSVLYEGLACWRKVSSIRFAIQKPVTGYKTYWTS